MRVYFGGRLFVSSVLRRLPPVLGKAALSGFATALCCYHLAIGPKRSGAEVGEAVTVCLEDEIDIARGAMLTSVDEPASVGKSFEAMVVWMSDKPLQVGAPYLIKAGAAGEYTLTALNPFISPAMLCVFSLTSTKRALQLIIITVLIGNETVLTSLQFVQYLLATSYQPR